MHLPPRPGAGPQAAHEGGDAAGHGQVLQAAAELPWGESWEAGAPEDAGEGGQGHAVLHQGLRPEPGRSVYNGW